MLCAVALLDALVVAFLEWIDEAQDGEKEVAVDRMVVAFVYLHWLLALVCLQQQLPFFRPVP